VRVPPWQLTPSAGRIAFAGELRIDDAAAIWHQLAQLVAQAGPTRRLDLDLSAAAAVDGAVMALVVELRASLQRRGIAAEIIGATSPMAAVVHLYGGDRPSALEPAVVREGAIARLGTALLGLGQRARRAISFAGDLASGTVAVIRRPRVANWRELAALIGRAGTDGVPIVLVLDFLVGFVMAYQSTRQLENYGANLYVADIVGVSLTRELAPLITAIIIAGRSGAGFAAELGTMRVSEELDALATLGIAPIPYLVVPRVLALAIAAPVLALLGDIAGVFGGLVVGAASLDVHPRAYMNELREVVAASDVWTGLVKSIAFGIAIAIIGCQQGLSTRGAAQGVGRSTTTTVVVCLFTLVAIDTALTMLFRGVGA
jgi:phospholipid/cholesterol/gamma-HCH transport system permease protein